MIASKALPTTCCLLPELRLFRSSPAQSFLTVGKSLHLNDPTLTNGIDVCKIDVGPLAAALGPDVRMNKHHNAIADRHKLYRLTRSFGKGGTRLAEVASRPFAAMVGPASRKLRWLTPLDMFVERSHGRIDVPAIERSVCPTKSDDCAFPVLGLGFPRGPPFPPGHIRSDKGRQQHKTSRLTNGSYFETALSNES